MITSSGLCGAQRASRAGRDRSAWHPRTVLIALGMTACGAAQHPIPAGQQRVDSVELVPVDRTKITVSKKELLGGLALERARKVGDPFDRYLLATDQNRLKAWYMRNGFFRAQITADAADQGRDAVKVTFKIDEGQRAKLAGVDITGLPNDPKVDAAEVRKAIALKDGAPFDYAPYDAAKPAIEAMLPRWGYPKGNVTMRVDADLVNDTATIRIAFDPGPLCTFGAITIKGTDGALAEAARNRISMIPGQRYSADDMADSRARLYDMKRFATVRMEPDLSDGTVVPVLVTVDESTKHELRLGGGVGVNPTSYEVHGRAGYTIAGFPGSLETTHLELKPALVRLRESGAWDPRVEALVSMERMDLFRPLMTGTAEVGYQWITVEGYTSTGPHVQLGLKTPLYRRYLQASADWHLEQLNFRALSPALPPDLRQSLGLLSSQRNGYYEETLIADLRDDAVEPRLGAYGEIRAHEGTVAAGGAFTYLRIVPEVRGYLPLGPVVFATRARMGTIIGDIPVTERFFEGGANSHRGFGERSLSPFVSGVVNGILVNVPYGGGAMAELSEEARFPIAKIIGMPFGGVVFIDGGDDTERFSDLRWTDLHWAPGVGLRIHSPVGAVRVDIAYRINRFEPGEPQAGSHIAFHFSIGEAF